MSSDYRPKAAGGPTACSRRSSRPVMGVALLVLLVALGAYGAVGCGGGGDGTAVGSEDSVTHPTGAKELVLQVFAHDGFVPVSYNLTQLPEFSLYGDGTVVVNGPVIEIYPGAALPNLQTVTISEEAVQAILSAAREAGLLNNDVDYGQPGITDMPMTSIVVNADKTTYRSDIYALGMESGAGGLTMEQQQARAAINSLAGKLVELTSFESGEIKWAPYQYSALAVFSVAIDPNTTTDSTDVQPNRLEWPLGDLSTLGEAVQPEGYRKVVVSGEDLVTLGPLLSEATQITVWASGDREYNLYFRPLLPGETE